MAGRLTNWLKGQGEGGSGTAAPDDAVAQLRAAKEAAEAANEAKTRFLASVSHEIRSPLNAIYGYAQLLERNEGKDAVSAARVIRRSAEHLSHLVEGLLDISQVEGGALRLSREAIRFPEFLDQLIAMLELQAQAKGLALVLDRQEHLPEFVHADPKRLRQVLINLVANAIKFTDHGAVTLKVAYRNQLATFTVIDTGIGIAPEDTARIFAPFERVGGEAGERAGVGLGLAITQALVHIMGGEIRVESALGEGSRFTVRLMLSQPLAPPTDPAPEPGAVTGYLGRERWVVLIDDDPAHLAMVRGLLEPLGFQVRTASDGEGALALAAQVQPDLVLCDVMLVGESGWDVAARLRRRHGAALKIVMLSGEGPRSGGPLADGPANDTFIMKPFDFTVLLDVIAAQLGMEWVRAPGLSGTAAEAPGGAAPLPFTIAPRAAAHCAEIERLVRIGHVRAIEAEIDAIAALAPEAALLADRMRGALDSFDLKALASLAKAVQADAA
ncbi:ATP-binding protein [Porphyrobacter sp. ULC335]|uniref:ATP-binding response regulator n=1 Tax=Porphyrobacter sp. ULC335 TaxID=2854260 RepID=UPI00221F1C0C|nr:ATP-binding protein [Porphyrobacter sp. ULC335]UYV15361.1 response regulator [Porphyrobacter sp. ULC335]